MCEPTKRTSAEDKQWLDDFYIMRDAQREKMLASRPAFFQALREQLPDIVDDNDPDFARNVLWGGSYAHFPFHRADDTVILLRIRLYQATPDDLHTYQEVAESEAAVMRAAHGAGAPVPAVYTPVFTVERHVGFAVEYMPGSTGTWPITEQFPVSSPAYAKLVHDVARAYISLSALQLPMYGSLCTDGSIGRSLEDLIVSESLLKPFPSYRAYWQAYLDDVIARDWIKTVPGTLGHIECEALLYHPAFDDTDKDRTFYIQRWEDNSTQYLVHEDGRLAAMLDWESSYTTCKGDAFSAPRSLRSDIDRAEFINGNNDMNPGEVLLANAYETLGRPDLAQCVRDGKKYQRLALCARNRTPYRQACWLNALREAVGEKIDKDESLENWIARLKVTHADDERLKRVIKLEEAAAAAAAAAASKVEAAREPEATSKGETEVSKAETEASRGEAEKSGETKGEESGGAASA
ncbi:hypothetical protein Q5752_004915 [Cryptotrichosporon argae]